MTGSVSAVLFDLDGTLLDTAPDMVPTLNRLCREEGAGELRFATARAYVSHGVRGLLTLAFGLLPDAEFDRLRCRFLDLYAVRLAEETRLFPGMGAVLTAIEAASLPWGVVTNKPGHLTEPLLIAMGLRHRCACVVSGDTTPQRKPHPAPLLHALAALETSAAAAIYVGDAARDIAAGRAAGMRTVAALYGYIPPEEDPERWGADDGIGTPAELLTILAGTTRCGREA